MLFEYTLRRQDGIASHSLSEMLFRKLMLMMTIGVEFSFDDIMYLQVDGVAMGGSLVPMPANIFVGYCKSCILNMSIILFIVVLWMIVLSIV